MKRSLIQKISEMFKFSVPTLKMCASLSHQRAHSTIRKFKINKSNKASEQNKEPKQEKNFKIIRDDRYIKLKPMKNTYEIAALTGNFICKPLNNYQQQNIHTHIKTHSCVKLIRLQLARSSGEQANKLIRHNQIHRVVPKSP